MKKFLQTRVGKECIGLCVLFIALAFVPAIFSGSLYIQHIATMVLFYAYAASAWNILSGFVGDISLGHCVFIGVGGYTSCILFNQLGISPWIGMIAGMGVSILFGVIIGLPCFRLRGPYFTIATIAFAELVRQFVENNSTLGPIDLKGSMGFVVNHNPDSGPGVGSLLKYFLASDKAPFYWLMLIFLIIVVFLTLWIRNSRLGNYLIAIQSNQDAAESLGIPVTKYKLIAMSISCGLIAVCGTFYAQFFRYIGPTRIFGIDLSMTVALIALIGGRGTVFGPVLGAFLIVPLTEFLSARYSNVSGLNLFVYGIILCLVVLYLPKGIIGIPNMIRAQKAKKDYLASQSKSSNIGSET